MEEGRTFIVDDPRRTQVQFVPSRWADVVAHCSTRHRIGKRHGDHPTTFVRRQQAHIVRFVEWWGRIVDVGEIGCGCQGCTAAEDRDRFDQRASLRRATGQCPADSGGVLLRRREAVLPSLPLDSGDLVEQLHYCSGTSEGVFVEALRRPRREIRADTDDRELCDVGGAERAEMNRVGSV